MISIIAKFIVNNGEEEKFIQMVHKLGEASRAEEGCFEYILHKNVEKALTYCIIEKWKDQDAIDKHNSSAHFTTIVPQISKIAQAHIDIYQPV